MKTKHLFLLPLLFAASVAATPAAAKQIVCLINQSAKAIKVTGRISNTPDFPTKGEKVTLEYDARGGDQNKCWHVPEGYALYLDYEAKNAAGKWEDPAMSPFAYFKNNLVVKSAWYKYGQGNKSIDWPADERLCALSFCVYHTTHTDVWRLYLVDPPAKK